MAINLNKLAEKVAEREGGKVRLPIGQIKEAIRITLEELADNYTMAEAVELLERTKRRLDDSSRRS